MSPIFQYNFDKPGPGVNPNEPRKTGYRRFAELLSLSGWSFFKAGILACFAFLPFYIGLATSVVTHQFPLMLVSSLLGGAIAGPQITGLVDTILRAQRDEPGIWWLTYKAAWKKNWKASLVPGALAGFLSGSLVFVLLHLNTGALSVFVLLGMAVSALLCLSVFTYMFSQIALFDMGLGQILRNAMLLTLRHPLRTLGGALLQALYWGIFLAYYPFSQLILPITGLWFPLFVGLSVIYPPMEAEFNLEALVKEHQEKAFSSDET